MSVLEPWLEWNQTENGLVGGKYFNCTLPFVLYVGETFVSGLISHFIMKSYMFSDPVSLMHSKMVRLLDF